MIDDQTIAPPSPSAAFLARLTPLPMQERFVRAGERFSFYVGGVGAGKSTAGAVRALVRALDQPGSLGLIGAPTYPMLRDATQRTVFELLDLLGEGYARSYHKSEGRLTLENGSEILLRSMDEPDRVRGLNLAWFWLDEAPLCGYYAWQILKGRLRQKGYATAGWATGTPRGRDGFWRDFEHAPRPHHTLYRAATHANAANLPPDYVSDLGLTGALYEQEVLGLFTAFAGLVYAFTADASDGNVREPPDAGKPWKDVIGGVDWGYTHPTAALVFGVDGDGRAWQLAEYYQRRAPLDADVLPAILDLTRRYGVRAWYGGPDEPEHLAALRTALLRAELPCRVLPGDDAVRAGIQTVTKLLARRADGTRGLYVAPACVNTIAEYGAYQWAPEPVSPLAGPLPLAGRDAAAYAEVPLKMNDDAMDATRYALHTALGRAHPAQAAWDAWLLMRERARDRERERTSLR